MKRRWSLCVIVILLCFLSACRNFNEYNPRVDVNFVIELPKKYHTEKVIKSKTAGASNNLTVQLKSKDGNIIKEVKRNVESSRTNCEVVFEEINVGTIIQVCANLEFSSIIYTGQSEWITIKAGINEINLTLSSEASGEAEEEEEEEDASLGSEGNPITNWDDLVSEMKEDGDAIYISGNMTADETLYIENAREIIATNGGVTITRGESLDGSVFTLNAALIMTGSESAPIVINGNNIETTQSMIYSTSNNITLKYVTIINCISTEIFCSAIYQMGGESLNLTNCSFENNSFDTGTVCVSNEAIDVNIESCIFTDNGIGLNINKSNSTIINKTSFKEIENENNIVITNCPNLTLAGELKIPQLNFLNYTGSQLNITCSNISLLESGVLINIILSNYVSTEDNPVDIELFTLNDGETVPDGIFTLGNAGYVINSSTGKIEAVATATTSTTVSTFEGLKSTISSANSTSVNDPFVIGVSSSFDVTEAITISSHIKLIASGTSDITLSRGSSLKNENLFIVSSSSSLTLGDENASGNLIIDGGGAAASPIESTKSLINVSSGGTLLLSKKSILQNNSCPATYTTHGAAVYSNGGSIIIKGGTVKNNATDFASNYGGGIYLKDGTFNMSSGVFENNSANKVGGGLYITNSTVNITGGEFSNNKLTGSESPQEGYCGSAFYLDSILSESTISNLNFIDNSNAGYGTFYIIDSGTSENVATISNCTFSSNNAYQRGGAIYTSSSYITIEGSTFSSNTVTSETGKGGAVYLYNSTLNISRCTFSSNIANSVTNTIYAEDEGSSLTIDGVNVSGYPWNPE